MLLVVFLVLISLTHVSSLATCPKCGGIEVSYPLSTNQNCGNPRYRVRCNDDILDFLSADGFNYKIISIDLNANQLIIIFKKTLGLSSDLPSGGLRLNDKFPFNISSHDTVMTFNCSSIILASPLNCSSSSICWRFEGAEGRGCKGTFCCHYKKDASMTSYRIRIRAGGCTAYTSAVDIRPDAAISLWKQGIELQWLPPDSDQPAEVS